ncbi:MAG: MBL fold metallo-hydrolase [Ruminococcaceae bacterium]|nr:MBL fold metallo-hydrolase [Oscillospiraceae bacterium]
MKIDVIASGSTGNCYLISDGKTKLMLECGIRFKKLQQAVGFTLSSISGCLITHEHKDHSHSVSDLLRMGIG